MPIAYVTLAFEAYLTRASSPSSMCAQHSIVTLDGAQRWNLWDGMYVRGKTYPCACSNPNPCRPSQIAPRTEKLVVVEVRRPIHRHDFQDARQ